MTGAETDMDAPWAKNMGVAAFEEFDIDDLLAKLTPEEIEELANETDPDVSSHVCFAIAYFRLIVIVTLR